MPELPAPVYTVAIAAKTPAHEDRLANALRNLLTEDPTLAVVHDGATRQTLLSGSGETHISVALARVERLGIDVEVGETHVAYRETLSEPVEVEGRFKKQSGGHGQFGVVTVFFEPLPQGSGFEFESRVTGGAIPKNLIPAVGVGIEEAMARGGKFGFPIVDIRAVCLDGKHHSVDSSEMSFKMAGSIALAAALEKAGTAVLEPISEVSVRVPSRYQGEVLGDLNAKRGQVLGSVPDLTGDGVTIEAHVPASEVQRYAIELRSMSAGTGTFEVAHHDYRPLPEAMLDRITGTASG